MSLCFDRQLYLFVKRATVLFTVITNVFRMTFIMVKFVLNKCCSFELSVCQKILKQFISFH